MPTIRAKAFDVLAQVNAQIALDARAAAGANGVLSKSEQGALVDGDTLKSSADDVRAAGSSRVTVDALVTQASSNVAALLAQVNTSTPANVSKSEIVALAGLAPDAGARVAKAYELITGRHIDLPSTAPVSPPVTPPPSSTGALPIGALTVTPRDPANPSFTLVATPVGEGMQLSGRILTSSIDLVVGTGARRRTVHTVLDASVAPSGPTVNLWDTRDIVEALRRAAPDLDVRVTAFARGKLTFDLWPAGAAPAVPNAPVYMAFAETSVPSSVGFHLTGPLALKVGDSAVAQGAKLAVRVDNKVYTATAHTSSATVSALVRDIRDQLQADGRTVVFKHYSNGLTSLRVTG